MDAYKKEQLIQQGKRTMEALEKNRMKAYLVSTKEEALALVKNLIPSDSLVSTGGSVTLEQCGITQWLAGGDCRFLDRNAEGLTPQQREEVTQQAFLADVYLCSANAITEQGELYNVDGNSNRVAALVYGPKKVIVVAGINKLVADIDEAVQRVKRIAAPANARRLGCDTYCAEKGRCVSDRIGQGCRSPRRICANYVISAYQRIPERIQVILVEEELGY